MGDTETVRALLEAWDAGDVERILDHLDPDAELVPLRAQLEGTEYRGATGLLRLRTDLDRDWENLRFEVDEFREREGMVVSLGHLEGKGRTSSIDLRVPIAFLWRLRDDRVVFVQSYSDAPEALRAAGIED